MNHVGKNGTIIPEPSTIIRFAVGLLGIIGISYRRRKKVAYVCTNRVSQETAFPVFQPDVVAAVNPFKVCMMAAFDSSQLPKLLSKTVFALSPEHAVQRGVDRKKTV